MTQRIFHERGCHRAPTNLVLSKALRGDKALSSARTLRRLKRTAQRRRFWRSHVRFYW